MNQEKIKKQFPSICYQCNNNRRPPSDVNVEKGYVGCAEYSRRMRTESEKEDISFVTEFEQLGEGWVDLKSHVFGKSSGITTNFQLLTKGVKRCTEFEQIEE